MFSVGSKELLGYFTLALKPLSVRGETVSKTTKRKLLRISELDENSDTYTMSAYLIAHLGKVAVFFMEGKLPFALIIQLHFILNTQTSIFQAVVRQWG